MKLKHKQSLTLRDKILKFLLTFMLCALFMLSVLLPTTLAQEYSSSISPSGTPKNVRDNLRERVEEKLTQLSNKPRALIGKITEIQDGSLLIETKDGVKQLKLGANVTVIDARDSKNKKTLDGKSLVLGDLIVALGFQNSKDVLEGRRILVISELPTSTRRAVYGIVEELKKDSLIIRHPKKDEMWTIKVDSKTRFTKKSDGKVQKAEFSDVETGDRIVAVGTPTKETNTLMARLIHVIPGKAKGLIKSPSPSPSTKPGPSSTPKPKSTPAPTPTQ